jgi:hypothetical protein
MNVVGKAQNKLVVAVAVLQGHLRPGDAVVPFPGEVDDVLVERGLVAVDI